MTKKIFIFIVLLMSFVSNLNAFTKDEIVSDGCVDLVKSSDYPNISSDIIPAIKSIGEKLHENYVYNKNYSLGIQKAKFKIIHSKLKVLQEQQKSDENKEIFESLTDLFLCKYMRINEKIASNNKDKGSNSDTSSSTSNNNKVVQRKYCYSKSNTHNLIGYREYNNGRWGNCIKQKGSESPLSGDYPSWEDGATFTGEPSSKVIDDYLKRGILPTKSSTTNNRECSSDEVKATDGNCVKKDTCNNDYIVQGSKAVKLRKPYFCISNSVNSQTFMKRNGNSVQCFAGNFKSLSNFDGTWYNVGSKFGSFTCTSKGFTTDSSTINKYGKTSSSTSNNNKVVQRKYCYSKGVSHNLIGYREYNNGRWGNCIKQKGSESPLSGDYPSWEDGATFTGEPSSKVIDDYLKRGILPTKSSTSNNIQCSSDEVKATDGNCVKKNTCNNDYMAQGSKALKLRPPYFCSKDGQNYTFMRRNGNSVQCFAGSFRTLGNFNGTWYNVGSKFRNLTCTSKGFTN